MSKLSVKKVPVNKMPSKQLKISSFFSQGLSGSNFKNNSDNKQSKISSYFSSGKNDKPCTMKKPANFIKQKSDLGKVLEEIDLTEEDDKVPKTIPLFPLKSNSQNSGGCSQNLIENSIKINSTIKLSDKENSPIKCRDSREHSHDLIKENPVKTAEASPDVVLPTPPKNADNKKTKKGLKRKFTFSDCSNSKDDITSLVMSLELSKASNESIKKDEININKIRSINFDRNCEIDKNPAETSGKATIVGSGGYNTKYCDLKSNKKGYNHTTHILQGEETKKRKSNDSICSESVLKYQKTISSELPTKNTNKIDIVDNKSVEKDSDMTGVIDSQKKSCEELKNDIDFTIDNIFDDWNDDVTVLNREIDLDKFTRCSVVSIHYSDHGKDMVISVKDCTSLKRTNCTLQGSWSRIVLREEDTVCILAEWNDNMGWLVTNTAGYVVLEPDTLIAGTTLVGSLFCMRRAILTDMFRGLDSTSEVMVIGSLLHEILQEVLKNKLRTKEQIQRAVDKITSTDDFIFTLYSSNITISNVKKQLDIFIPQIVKFISSYIKPISEKTNEDCWKGEIAAIEDIEENIWATNLGLKGKIDVTVKVNCHNKIVKTMPLELKTGRASFSSEHRGQVILYSLMMSELGKNVDSGLLLYLREGVMKEVKAGTMEKRDLILLRNEFVRFTKERENVDISNEVINVPAFPEPINHLRGCTSCPYLTVCSAALKEDGFEKLSQSNPLHGLSVPALEHLKSEHIRFVFHWVGLLQLENKEIKRGLFSVKDIWNLKPDEREKGGSGACNMKLDGEVMEGLRGQYKHRFVRDVELPQYVITKGDYLIVSTDHRVAIAAGIVSNVDRNSCTIHLERDLSPYKSTNFHLDKYESQSQLVFNMTNLAHLLESSPECNWLRDKIISMELPIYSRLSSEILKVGQDVLSELNKGQKHAVLQALAAQHYLLIKGMPGTGKTATLVSLIKLLVRLGQSVLITSHTHSAVDNVLRKLPKEISILRLGSLSRVHSDVQIYSEQHITANTPEELENIFNSKQVVGVTCLGAGHPLLRRRKFDIAVVDEATQVLLPTTLRPLFAASKFILVGDPKQLPPLVRSPQASDLGLRQSLFSYLDRPSVTSELTTQYRMNACINDLANGLTYEGKLECANESISQATIKLESTQIGLPAWMSLPLSAALKNSVVILDSGYVSHAKSSNLREGEHIIQLVKAYLKGGLDKSQIGVIAPYQAQVVLLRNLFKTESIDVEVSTVDTFQGRDKDVIIYSCTRSSYANELGLLSDHNRLTVAVTRAKLKLVFIGDVQTLKSYAIFQKMFSLVDNSYIVKLPIES